VIEFGNQFRELDTLLWFLEIKMTRRENKVWREKILNQLLKDAAR
jgi:hypothetical protein